MNNKNLNECHPELDCSLRSSFGHSELVSESTSRPPDGVAYGSASINTGFRIKSGMTGIWIILVAFGLTACSSAGPYVTNISRNKNGDLVVEKCMLEHNAFLGTVYNENCTNQSI